MTHLGHRWPTSSPFHKLSLSARAGRFSFVRSTRQQTKAHHLSCACVTQRRCLATSCCRDGDLPVSRTHNHSPPGQDPRHSSAVSRPDSLPHPAVECFHPPPMLLPQPRCASIGEARPGVPQPSLTEPGVRRGMTTTLSAVLHCQGMVWATGLWDQAHTWYTRHAGEARWRTDEAGLVAAQAPTLTDKPCCKDKCECSRLPESL